MQITKQTIDILRNFSMVNSSILINPGQELKTVSDMKTLLARATVTEEFPTQFAIYDLPQFLNVVTSPTYQGADYAFKDDSVNITLNGSSCEYYYADETTVVTPTKDIRMPEGEITFELTDEQIQTVRNMASILSTPDLACVSEGGSTYLNVLDKKNDKSNNNRLEVGDGNGTSYEMYFKMENLKLLKGDYIVDISSKNISHFAHKNLDLEYWIALEPDSTYDIVHDEVEDHENELTDSLGDE